MSSSPSSSVVAARKAIADRLAEIRKDARLTGEVLSARCGWHPAKTSRIQSGKSAPSEDDIRVWCAACKATSQIPDLIAALRAVESMYVEWRRLQHTGLRSLQESYVARYERTWQFRVYCSVVVPGLLQTAAYATALLESVTQFQDIPNDVPEAVQARMDRASILRQGNHRFAFLIEESVLRSGLGGAEAMAGQLGHLLSLMSLPSVSLGIIPFGSSRSLWMQETFVLLDDNSVEIELLTARVTVTQPREVADYTRAFERLAAMAVYGARARALITSAIVALE
ncbi:helix-turn-helix domain-containing protein [Streptacidiphilus sp. PB12-B1b]|uniref:helix-turn-helix domain-containing protein n=1 Tax=Streptacidiphilus sp. PB12-B1b TaxID=2705012 RepID=UPI0015FD4B5C|nr:helix-turn-helix transcriptional regulator [Streptacidiphilus sp. PB12-B1b]QMU77464.1 helix-turn-helix domain-containing protein [Streptacidiphilus sp. PB12-B1b]